MALHHARPGEVVALGPIGPKLKDTRTSAITKTGQFEAIRLIIPAGSKIPEHKVAGEITLYCLEGHVEFGVAPVPIALKANEWVYLRGGAPHSVKAIEDSSVLLTIVLDHGPAEAA